MDDLYSVLGVSKNASAEEIKKAFYKNEIEAEQIAESRASRITGAIEAIDPDDFVE